MTFSMQKNLRYNLTLSQDIDDHRILQSDLTKDTTGPRFDLTTLDSYFMTLVNIFMNHILAKNTFS